MIPRKPCQRCRAPLALHLHPDAFTCHSYVEPAPLWLRLLVRLIGTNGRKP